jgi:predicted AAA+ superfamily ATPase
MRNRKPAAETAQADRDPSRGHREPAGADGRCCAARPFRFIVFCDDLSFDGDDTSYKSLKAVLEGGIEGRPDNVILYATSNRRHLMAREMMENERSTAINPGEAVEEKVSLSDRFGLWLGFHRCSQDEYLAMVKGYCGHFGIKLGDELEREALEWSTTRGSRSGRVAWQFTQDWRDGSGSCRRASPAVHSHGHMR